MPKSRDANLVWSSDDGDLRRARPTPYPTELPNGDRLVARAGQDSNRGGPGSRVKVRRETAGRRGKAVTTVSGLPLNDDGLRAVAGRLKRRCGVGGSVKDGVIELQGDHRTLVALELRVAGYDVVLAGG
jgi:translation initiation factor 1